MINLNVSKIKILNYTCCNTTVYLGTGSFNLPRGKSGLDLFLDSSEFFKGCQVVKSPEKALKRHKKVQKRPFQARPLPYLVVCVDIKLSTLSLHFSPDQLNNHRDIFSGSATRSSYLNILIRQSMGEVVSYTLRQSLEFEICREM